VKNINVSTYNASLRVKKPYTVNGQTVYAYHYKGVDKNGNVVNIEYAPDGHPSNLGGNEPPHVKVQIKNKENQVVHNSKYFIESDSYRLKE